MTSSKGETAAKSARNRKRRPLKTLFKVLFGLLLVLILLIALAPILISTGAGTARVVKLINGALAGPTLSVEDIALRWGRGQQITGLVYKDPAQEMTVEVAKVDAADLSLMQLLRGNLDVGKITITRPEITRVLTKQAMAEQAEPQPKAEETAKPASAGAEAAGEPLKLPSGIAGFLEIVDGHAHFALADKPPLEVTLDQATLDIASLAKMDIGLNLHLVQGDILGQMSVQGSADKWFDDGGTLQLDQGTLSLEVAADRFALGSLESVVGPAASPVVPLLGPEMDLLLSVQGGMKQLTSSLKAKSEQLDLQASVDMDEAGLAITDGTRLDLNFSTEAWQALTTKDGEAAPARLQQPFQVLLSLSSLNIPRTKDGWAWTETAANMALNLGDIILTRPDDSATYALKSTKLNLGTGQLAAGLKATLESVASLNDSEGRVSLDVDVQDLLLANGEFNQTGVKGRAKGLLSDVPLAVADQFLQSDGMLVSLVGPELNLRVDADIAPGAEGGDLDGAIAFEANAKNVDGKIVAMISKGMLTAPGENRISVTLTPEGMAGLGAFLNKGQDVAPGPVGFDGARTVTVALERLSVPLKQDSDAAQAGIDAQVRMEGLPFAVVDYLAAQDGKISALLGDQLDELVVHYHQPDAGPGPAAVGLTVKTPNLGANLGGKIQPDEMIEINPGSYVELNLEPEAVGKLAGSEDESPVTLMENARLRAEIAALNLVLLPGTDGGETGVDWAKSKLELNASSPGIHGRLSGQGETHIRDFALSIVGTNPEQLIQVSLNAHLQQGLVLPAPGISDDDSTASGIQKQMDAQLDLAAELQQVFGESGLLKAKGSLKSLSSEDEKYLPISMELRDVQVGLGESAGQRLVADASLYSIPVGLLDALSGQGGGLEALLGGLIEEMTVKLDQASGDSGLAAQCLVRSPNLDGDLAARVRVGELIEMQSGSFVQLRVTPEAWDIWVPANESAENGDVPVRPLMLEEPTTIRADIKSMRIPLPEKQAGGEDTDAEQPVPPLDLRNASLDLAISDPHIVLQPHGGGLLHYRDLAITLDGRDLSRPVKLLVKGEVEQEPGPDDAQPAAAARPTATASSSAQPQPARQAQVATQPRQEARTETQTGGAGGGLFGAVLGGLTGSGTGGVVQAQPVQAKPVQAKPVQAQPANAPGTRAVQTDPGPTAPVEVEQVITGPGRIHLEFELDRLLNEQGSLQLEQAVMRSASSLRGLPLTAVDAGLGMDGQLVGIMGPTSSLTMTGEVSMLKPGPMRFLMNSENALLRVATADYPESVRFQEDAVASIKLTPILSQVLLKKVNPMLVNAIGADQPILFTVDSKTTQVPMGGDMLKDTLMNARLELHSVTMGAGDILSGLLNALNRKTSDSMTVSFQPMNLHIENGVLSYTDAWMTVDNLAMVVEGNVDLVQDFMDLRISISGETLALAFRELRDVVSKTDVISIPLRGPIDKPRLDTAGLFAEIAKIAAKGALKKNLDESVGGEAGALIDAILGGGQGNSKQPPPSLRPEESGAEQSPDDASKSDAKPAEEDPVQQLFNILGGKKSSDR